VYQEVPVQILENQCVFTSEQDEGNGVAIILFYAFFFLNVVLQRTFKAVSCKSLTSYSTTG